MSDQIAAPEAERALIGACLLDANAYARAALDAADFHDMRHRALWRAISRCIDAGRPVDPVTVQEALDADGKAKAVGGYDYLGQLLVEVVSADNVQHYAEIVRAYASARATMAALSGVLDDAQGGRIEPGDVFDAATSALAEVRSGRISRRDAVPLSRVVRSQVEAVTRDVQAAERGEARTPRISSGLVSLDVRIGGGFGRGSIAVVGARPGGGKTSLLMQIARRAPVPALVFAFEEITDLAYREIAIASDVDAVAVAGRRFSSGDELGRVFRAATVTRDDVYLVDARGMDAHQLASEIRAQVLEHDIGIVVVDYLNRIHHPRADRYDLAIRRTMDILDNVIGELGVACVIGAQLSRSVAKENRPPRMDDLRDSGAVEEIAKLGIVLHRPYIDRSPDEGGDSEVWLIIDKQNIGQRRAVMKCEWDGPRMTIGDRTGGEDDERYT